VVLLLCLGNSGHLTRVRRIGISFFVSFESTAYDFILSQERTLYRRPAAHTRRFKLLSCLLTFGPGQPLNGSAKLFSARHFASFFHDVGSNARTTSLSHSHPLGTKITRQPRGLDAFLWAPHFAASTPSLGRYISRRLFASLPATFFCDSARYIFCDSRAFSACPPFLSGPFFIGMFPK